MANLREGKGSSTGAPAELLHSFPSLQLQEAGRPPQRLINTSASIREKTQNKNTKQEKGMAHVKKQTPHISGGS